MTTSEVVQGLREFADFLEAHPAFAESINDHEFSIYAPTREEFVALARELGNAKKDPCQLYFSMVRTFGLVKLCVFSDRDTVCERKVVGTRIVPAHIIPASPETEVPEKIEEIVEWDCKPILAEEVTP